MEATSHRVVELAGLEIVGEIRNGESWEEFRTSNAIVS